MTHHSNYAVCPCYRQFVGVTTRTRTVITYCIKFKMDRYPHSQKDRLKDDSGYAEQRIIQPSIKCPGYFSCFDVLLKSHCFSWLDRLLSEIYKLLWYFSLISLINLVMKGSFYSSKNWHRTFLWEIQYYSDYTINLIMVIEFKPLIDLLWTCHRTFWCFCWNSFEPTVLTFTSFDFWQLNAPCLHWTSVGKKLLMILSSLITFNESANLKIESKHFSKVQPC
jgi:hypothetical protein